MNPYNKGQGTKCINCNNNITGKCLHCNKCNRNLHYKCSELTGHNLRLFTYTTRQYVCEPCFILANGEEKIKEIDIELAQEIENDEEILKSDSGKNTEIQNKQDIEEIFSDKKKEEEQAQKIDKPSTANDAQIKQIQLAQEEINIPQLTNISNRDTPQHYSTPSKKQKHKNGHIKQIEIKEATKDNKSEENRRLNLNNSREIHDNKNTYSMAEDSETIYQTNTMEFQTLENCHTQTDKQQEVNNQHDATEPELRALNEPDISNLSEKVGNLVRQVRLQTDENDQREITGKRDGNNLQATSPVNTRQINCKYHMKRECMHSESGKGCKFNHPVLCEKLLKYGNLHANGCHKIDCIFAHPTMCEQACKQQFCRYGTRCWFRHPTHLRILPARANHHQTQTQINNDEIGRQRSPWKINQQYNLTTVEQYDSEDRKWPQHREEYRYRCDTASQNIANTKITGMSNNNYFRNSHALQTGVLKNPADRSGCLETRDLDNYFPSYAKSDSISNNIRPHYNINEQCQNENDFLWQRLDGLETNIQQIQSVIQMMRPQISFLRMKLKDSRA